MQFKEFNGTLMLRLDPGEEVLQGILAACRKTGIRLAAVSGIGAARRVTCGVFDPGSHEYHSRTFEGTFEITSLAGTVTTMENALYQHVHITFAGPDYQVCGGHLNEAVVSATAEIVLQKIEGSLERRYSEAIGLNLLEF